MLITIAPPALLLATSAANQLVRALFDDTFAGIHHLDLFDWAMLIPYFTVLIIFSVYGCHRYEMIRTYFKHRDERATEPAERFDRTPARHHPASAV